MLPGPAARHAGQSPLQNSSLNLKDDLGQVSCSNLVATNLALNKHVTTCHTTDTVDAEDACHATNTGRRR